MASFTSYLSVTNANNNNNSNATSNNSVGISSNASETLGRLSGAGDK